MKVGFFTTNQQHLDKDMFGAFQEQVRMVHHVRDMGWDSVFSGQHFLNEGNNQQLQLVPYMSRLMAEAGELKTGLGVMLINLLNPIYIAETVATMDVMSGGNFVFGVGLGYRDVEFDAFNVPRGSRVKRFEEYLDIVTRLWAGEAVTYDGPMCKLNEATMNLRPIQQPRPPIWFAANNDAAIRRAARLGDNWFINPHSTVATVRRQMVIYREELEKHGKPFPTELPSVKEI